jgi:hypothetical protein
LVAPCFVVGKLRVVGYARAARDDRMAKPSSSKKPAPKAALKAPPKAAAKASPTAEAKAPRKGVPVVKAASKSATTQASGAKPAAPKPAAPKPTAPKPTAAQSPVGGRKDDAAGNRAAKPATRAAPGKATGASKARTAPLPKPPPIIAAKVELRPPPPPKHRAVLAAAAHAAATHAAATLAAATHAADTRAADTRAADTRAAAGAGSAGAGAPSVDVSGALGGNSAAGAASGLTGSPDLADATMLRPSRPPTPVTGTAAMKNLAQRNAAALRPSTDPAEISSEAQRILAEGDTAAVQALGEALSAERSIPQTCKVLDDVLAAKPDLLTGLVDRFVTLVASPQKRTVQTAAAALPVMARLAPARVARHLQALTERFPACSETGKDGLVSTFAALCMASVAYQKRLEPVLELALSSADPKSLQRWAEIILPSLKGEPHARARAVVENRLPSMPRPLAQPIATFLGIKLRPAAS